MADGTIHQLNTSTGGVPKRPILSATINELGIVGDGHADPGHGGPTKALCLFALEVIADMAAQGHPIRSGSVGENITTHGLDWSRVKPGARLRLGDQVRVEVTDYTTPCKKQTRWFTDGDISRLNNRVSPGRSRVYARVLHGGTVNPGDPISFE